MTAQGWLQIAIFVGVLTALAPPLGAYMARVYQGERVFLTRILGPLERAASTRLLRGRPRRGDRTGRPTRATVLVFSVLFWLVLYLILRTQGILPLNPEGFGSAPWDVTFNTTSSFVTNTNWQYYGGETTLTLLLADGRPGGAELRLGRGRDGGAGGRDPRVRQPGRQASWATSGRT